MQDILAELTRVRGVGGCLLLNADGLLMESSLRAGTDEQAVAGAAGALLDTARRACEAQGLGRQAAFSAHADQGGVLLIAAGPAHLLVLLDPNANIALLRLEVKPFLDRIAQRLAL
jgi:predicted regulator of Ras-like GTPase activity (Roadblock/LC7/MglB family)